VRLSCALAQRHLALILFGLGAGTVEWMYHLGVLASVRWFLTGYGLGVVVRAVAAMLPLGHRSAGDGMAIVFPSMALRHVPFFLDPTVSDLGLWPPFILADLAFHLPVIQLWRWRAKVDISARAMDGP
jgi:hypothetical protein